MTGARRRARRAAGALHRALGLAAGALFALLGLTGAVLVFYLEAGEALEPAIRASAPAAAPPSADALLARLREAFPERTGPWRLEMPLAERSPVRARYYRPAERADRMFAPLLVTLDPASLAVTSRRFWGDEPLTWLYDLHYSLALDRDGRTLVGVAGLAMLASLGLGAWIAWPSRARGVRAWLPAPRAGPVRRTYDVHALAGLYGAAVLALLAATGAALALPGPVHALLGTAGAHGPAAHGAHSAAAQGANGAAAHGAHGPTAHGARDHGPAARAAREHGPARPEAPEAGAAASLDDAIRTARRRFPGAEVRWIESSGADGEPVSVRLHQAFEPSRRFPRTQVWIDAASGAVVAVNDPRHASAADTLLAWLHPLHNGEAFGIAGRIVACAAGVLPALLAVTGWMRWRHKARARRAASARHAARPD
ncbi:MAG: PepSY-associated TM helix domain-containing protein [Burkholderiaceae bacterium]